MDLVVEFNHVGPSSLQVGHLATVKVLANARKKASNTRTKFCRQPLALRV